MSEITRGVIGMPYEMAMGSEMSRRQFYAIAREVYAENESLRGQLEDADEQVVALEKQVKSLIRASISSPENPS